MQGRSPSATLANVDEVAFHFHRMIAQQYSASQTECLPLDLQTNQFLAQCRANISAMLVVNQFRAAVRRWEYRASAFAVLPASTRQRISHTDVENRMITLCDDITQKL